MTYPASALREYGRRICDENLTPALTEIHDRTDEKLGGNGTVEMALGDSALLVRVRRLP